MSQPFANVTHGDSGGDTFFLKVSRATTKSAVLSHTCSRKRVTAREPFLTFKKVFKRFLTAFPPVSWTHLDYKKVQIKNRVMGYVNVAARFWRSPLLLWWTQKIFLPTSILVKSAQCPFSTATATYWTLEWRFNPRYKYGSPARLHHVHPLVLLLELIQQFKANL